MKKNNGKKEMVTVMIGGGDESIFIKVPKGKRILTPNGYIIAGETYEENKQRYEDRFDAMIKTIDEENKKYEKELLKEQKPDFKTLLYIKLLDAKIVVHPEVFSLDIKRKMNITCPSLQEVYVFKDFEEYRNYFLMYLNNVEDNDIIKLILYTGKKGHVVAYNGLCEQLIVKKATEEFYNSITQEQIDDIHSRGKLTPKEHVEQYEFFDLCAPGNTIESVSDRCHFFGNCHDCLLEYASHNTEYDPISFNLTNLSEPEKVRCRNNK